MGILLFNNNINMIKKFKIYSERCSGTNYLENLIFKNFDIELTSKFGHKHFFGFNDLKNHKNTLFVCIVRDIYTWINSLYRTPHHLRQNNCISINNFLSKEIISYEFNCKNFNGEPNQGKEILKDRNIYTNKRYKNIFELRHLKLKYLIEDLPTRVDNYIIIRYEDLLENFIETMNKIKECGLKVKKNIKFPLNETNYKKQNKKYKINNDNKISKELIYKNKNFNSYYEKKLDYY